jgi:hypothetical protein
LITGYSLPLGGMQSSGRIVCRGRDPGRPKTVTAAPSAILSSLFVTALGCRALNRRSTLAPLLGTLPISRRGRELPVRMDEDLELLKMPPIRSASDHSSGLVDYQLGDSSLIDPLRYQ